MPQRPPDDFEQALRRFHLAAGQAVDEELDNVPRNVARTLRDMGDDLEWKASDLKKQSDLASLRARLMIEELGEILEALGTQDRVELADGLADLIYVTVGTAVSYGIPIRRIFEEVHNSNMSKFYPCDACGGAGCEVCSNTGLRAELDAGGKVIKPPHFRKPDIEKILGESKEPS